MPGRWATVRLGDVVDLLTGFPFKSEGYVDDDNAPRLLRGDNIAQGVLRWEGAKRWPSHSLRQVAANYLLREGDVILAMDRPWIEAGLKYASVRPSDLPSLLVQRVACLRGTARLDTRFLKYVVGSQAFTRHVLSVLTGTAVPHISAGQVKSFEFLLPPIPEQRTIGRILGALDDKIELNRRMRETLEAMARGLFKSWFVDFDPVRAKVEGRDLDLPKTVAQLFPDSLEDSELGEIPRDWKVGTLADIAEHQRRGVEPIEIRPGTPYIALEHMPRRCIALSEWETADGLESNKFEFKKGEILFGKLRPYFHKVGVAPVDGVCSTDIVVISARERAGFGFVLGHVSSDTFVEYTNAGSTGTKMPRTSWSDMSRYPVVIPPKSILEAFTNQVWPLSERIVSSIHESRALAALRDSLLPKLMSGELRTTDMVRRIEKGI